MKINNCGINLIAGLTVLLAMYSSSEVFASNDRVSAAQEAATAAEKHLEQNTETLMEDFRTLLSIPNHARNLDDMMKNVEWITSYLEPRGFETQVWREGGAPYIFAERKVPGAKKTILLYAHFDGQPVDPWNWASPPFEPSLRNGSVESGAEDIDWETALETGFQRDWRIFARSAGDDKAPVVGIAHALDALEAAGIAPSVNIKLILDGEEEIGSPTAVNVLAKHAEELKSDLLLFCDGPMHASGKRQLIFGVRGSMTVDLTTYGPNRPLHSGHYGNYAPHPTDYLMRLLTSMKDDDGAIVIPGYSRQVRSLSDADKAAIAAMPNINRQLQRELALGRTEGNGDQLELLVLRPALVIKGFQAGGVGSAARNTIISQAQASINLRLVPDQTPQYVRRALESHIFSQGFHIVYEDPTDDILRQHERVIKVDWRPGGYTGYRSSVDGEEAKVITEILTTIDGEAPLLTPSGGGSLPIYLFAEALEVPIILFPIANYDNNQHGRNENMRLGNLFDAISAYAAVIAAYGE